MLIHRLRSWIQMMRQCCQTEAFAGCGQAKLSVPWRMRKRVGIETGLGESLLQGRRGVAPVTEV
uniref:Uncharacterized protein n=1 Tax=Arundo donax TaxID=35708 RepID=A0A0A9DE96_ARUDO